MPDDDLTFAKLCEHLGASPHTVRRDLREAAVVGRADGTSLKFTREQVEIIERYRTSVGPRPRGRPGRAAIDQKINVR